MNLPELEPIYYKARIYYPHIGMFVQTDPIGCKDDYRIYIGTHKVTIPEHALQKLVY